MDRTGLEQLIQAYQSELDKAVEQIENWTAQKHRFEGAITAIKQVMVKEEQADDARKAENP